MQTMLLPNRLLITASYSKDYAKHFGTMVGLVYEGTNFGYDPYAATRFSYTFAGNVVNDYKGSYSLLYVPASREALDAWNFSDYIYTDAKSRSRLIQQNSRRMISGTISIRILT